MRLCTHCGGDNPVRSIYGDYYCDDDCIGDHIESLRAEVESWENRYKLAMVCYKDEETTHTATLARLVEAEDKNAALLAAQKNFAASLTDRIAELEFQRDDMTARQRLATNMQIDLIQAIKHDYETAKSEAAQ